MNEKKQLEREHKASITKLFFLTRIDKTNVSIALQILHDRPIRM